jgi:hypothetical protein
MDSQTQSTNVSSSYSGMKKRRMFLGLIILFAVIALAWVLRGIFIPKAPTYEEQHATILNQVASDSTQYGDVVNSQKKAVMDQVQKSSIVIPTKNTSTASSTNLSNADKASIIDGIISSSKQ